MNQQQNRYFVVVAPGLEKLCAGEMSAIGLQPAGDQRGGIEFQGGLRELYLANLRLRTASRILVRLGDVSARDFPTLYQRLSRLPWGRFIKPGTACNIRAASYRSRLSHTGRVAETCRKAITNALGAAENKSEEKQKVFLRIEADQCQVSIDGSGELLHRRGYRASRVAAPLRETLAAGCLLALGYDGSQALVDAMTGSGTFAIEAALIALQRAPGVKRKFAFMDWPKYRPGLWQQLLLEAQREEQSGLTAPIIAVDNNPKAIVAAEQNLAAAGLGGVVQLNYSPMQRLSPPAPTGLILCNPPYGERLGRDAALQALYHDLGQLYAGAFAGWLGAIVCPETPLVQTAGLQLVRQLRFSNGGIPVSLLEKSGKK